MILSLYAAALRRPASVVRDGRHVRNAADLEPERIQRADRRLAPGARPLDAHLEILDPAFLSCTTGRLGGHLCGERRRLARALEPGTAGRRPRQRIALPV